MKSPIPTPCMASAPSAQVVLSPPELASHLATATARAKLGGETQHWDTGAMAGPVGRSLGFVLATKHFWLVVWNMNFIFSIYWE